MTKKGFRLPFARGTEDLPGDDAGHLREENRQLRRAIEELSILNELARLISVSVDFDSVIRNLVDCSMRAVRAEQTVVTLVGPRTSGPMHTLIRTMSSSAEHPHYHLTDNLLGWMHHYKRPLLTSNPANDERFSGLKWDPTIRSVLCVPLMVKSELIGVITSYNKKGFDGGFTEEDQRLLAIIAGQSAQIIENARLSEEEKALASMKEQVKLAAQIQQDLLPKQAPEIAGYDIAACSIAALVVGGDYYDFIPTRDRTSICLGDVSGKGLPASLLMANLQATLRGQTAFDMPVAETVARSNRQLHQSTDPEKFATLFVGVLEPESGVLSYCNAGHEHPMHFKPGGETHRLSVGGMALGVLDSFPYAEASATLEPGDILVVYSDGITDAVDRTETPFGEERLAACVREHAGLPADSLMKRIIDTVESHEQGTPRADDLTVIVIKRSGAAAP